MAASDLVFLARTSLAAAAVAARRAHNACCRGDASRTIAGGDRDWWADDLAERYRIALAAARRCYFVSNANRQLSEKQIGGELPNAEVIWNPLNVSCRAPLSWPPLSDSGELRLACVGRLYLPHKGQDLLFEALASPIWRERPWRLYLYGEGPMRGSLEWLAQRLGIADRVVFAGFASVEQAGPSLGRRSGFTRRLLRSG